METYPSILTWAPVALNSAADLTWQESASPQLMTVSPRAADPGPGSHTGLVGF